MQISSLLFKSTQMKKEYIPIYKIAGKIQYLTEVLPQIETNTILCKTLTGLGATYSEIKAKRHSIISVPNVPPIIGKCRDPKHKNDNLFGVKQGVPTEGIIDYITKDIKQQESLSKFDKHSRRIY